MKLLTITSEYRAYTEQEANEFIETFRKEAQEKGYTVKSAGWSPICDHASKAIWRSDILHSRLICCASNERIISSYRE